MLLRTSFRTARASRAPTPSASTAWDTTSTILKRRGRRGSGGLGSRGRGLGGTNSGSLRGLGVSSTLSRGTICAPGPFVEVSSTHVLRFITYEMLARPAGVRAGDSQVPHRALTVRVRARFPAAPDTRTTISDAGFAADVDLPRRARDRDRRAADDLRRRSRRRPGRSPAA